jgi:tetratricopeptide (TPR) repeat protein
MWPTDSSAQAPVRELKVKVPATDITEQPVIAAGADATSSQDPAAMLTARAHDHFVLGQNFYRARDYREALREFELSAELAPRAEIWTHIAQAHQELGEYTRAISAFERYLRQRGSGPDAENVRAQIARLTTLSQAARRRAPDQPRLGSLRVHRHSAQAKVFVDGQNVDAATLDSPLLLTEGRHRFDVVQALHVPLHATVDIQPGLLTTAYADLHPTTRARMRPAAHGVDFALLGVAGASALVSGTFALLSATQRSDGSLAASQAWAQRADIALAGTALCALAAVLVYHAVERSTRTELTRGTEPTTPAERP